MRTCVRVSEPNALFGWGCGVFLVGLMLSAGEEISLCVFLAVRSLYLKTKIYQ